MKIASWDKNVDRTRLTNWHKYDQRQGFIAKVEIEYDEDENMYYVSYQDFVQNPGYGHENQTGLGKFRSKDDARQKALDFMRSH